MRSDIKMTFNLISLSQAHPCKILILKYISFLLISIIFPRLLLKCPTLCQTSDLKVKEYQVSTISQCTDACSVPLPRDAVVADKVQISRLLHTLHMYIPHQPCQALICMTPTEDSIKK